MHITEKDEHLDYQRFYEEGIPTKGTISDEEWRKIIGNRAWAMLHGVVDNFPCETCARAGRVLVSGIHDMVNLHTGKPVFDHDKWVEFLGMVEEAKKKNEGVVHYRHERVADPDEFDPESFRTVKEGRHLIVVGCPTGHYRGGECEVGTRKQAVLHPVRDR